MSLTRRMFYLGLILAIFPILSSVLPTRAQATQPVVSSVERSVLNFTSLKGLLQIDLKVEPLARQGDWVYYLQPANPHKWQQADLFRSKTNGSNAAKILSGPISQASGIKFVKDWIYYNQMGKGGLHRIRPDGSEDQQLAERAGQFEVRGPYVIYESVDGLYRVDTDSKNRLRLDGGVKDYFVSSIFRIEGDWIYYQRVTQEQVDTRNRNISDFTYGLYRIKLDGSKKTTIIEEKLHGGSAVSVFPRPLQLAAAGDHIYYASSLSLDGAIYAVQKDGSNHHLVCVASEETSPRVTAIYASNHWIYYEYIYSSEKHLSALYKVRPNGSEKTLLAANPAPNAYPDEYQLARALGANINHDQEWVYYASRHEIYRAKADGSEKSRIYTAGTHDIYRLDLRGDYLYFNWVESSNTWEIKEWRCRIRTDGSGFTPVEAP